MNKFLFFKWGKESFINILIIIEIVVWILTVSQLISLLTFDNDYSKRFNNSFPVESGINVYKFSGAIDSKAMGYLESEHNESYMISQRKSIYKDEINIKPGVNREFMKEGLEAYSDSYNIVQMNYNYIDYLNKNIDSNMWNVNNDVIPVVLGKNFNDIYSIGDKIEGIDRQYEVIDILDKELIFSDGSQDPVANSESLNDAIITPINNINYESQYTLMVAGKSLEESKKIYEKLYSIDNEVLSTEISTRYEELMEMIDSRNLINILQSIITTLLAVFIIILTIKEKIDENSEKIGIILTYGGDSKYISNVFMKEISILLIISTIISIPITFKLTKISFFFFYNTNQMMTIFLSFIITLGILLISIRLSLFKIRNLTLRELIGGVRD